MPMIEIIDDTQVVVIGAGVIGCSIASFLAKRNASVTIIDSKGIGCGTTGATLGLLWVQGKEPVEYMELNRASVQLHAQLAEKLDEDVGFRRPGGLVICLDNSEFEKSLHVMHRLNSANPAYQAKSLSPKELCELEPRASPDIAGGIYSPNDGHINPIKLVLNLAKVAKLHGTKFLLNTPVIRVLLDEAGIAGVESGHGIIRSRNVVIAAGIGMPQLVEPLGLRIPLDFVRGELLVTTTLPPMLNYPSRHVRQTVEGNFLLGTTNDSGCQENSTTNTGAKKIANNAVHSFPFLREIPIIRHFAGIRPMPIDGLPYLGPVKNIPGLYIAVSHSGITLSAIFGKIISELILDGKTDANLNLYYPERFLLNDPQEIKAHA